MAFEPSFPSEKLRECSHSSSQSVIAQSLTQRVSSSGCSDTFIQSLDTSFFVGKPVKIKIINTDPTTKRLVASIRQALPGAKPSTSAAQVSTSDVEIGNIVEGTISALHKAHILVTLIPSQAKALLSKSNLAHHRGIPVDDLSASVKLGEKLIDLVVVAKDDDRSLLIVANKPKKDSEPKQPSGISQPSISIDAIPVGEIVPGRVVSHGPQGANVQISKSLRGRVHVTDSSDDYKKGTALPEIGSIVKAVVLKVEALTKRIDLSLRQSRVNPSSKSKVVDKEVESVEDLEVGQQVRGFVKTISDGGLFVSLGRDVTARVMIKDLFDEVSLLSPLPPLALELTLLSLSPSVRQGLEASLRGWSGRRGKGLEVRWTRLILLFLFL